jgi:hypothetical protein
MRGRCDGLFISGQRVVPVYKSLYKAVKIIQEHRPVQNCKPNPNCGSMHLSPILVCKMMVMLLLIFCSLALILSWLLPAEKVTRKDQPDPKNYFRINLFAYPPISTLNAPNKISPPCAVWSPSLAAGIPPIITVADPFIIVSGGPTHINISPTRAAGMPAIKTVGSPGPLIGPPTWGIGTGPGFIIGHL